MKSPKYIIYSYSASTGKYFCILDRACARCGYYSLQSPCLRKRISKKLVCFLLPSFYRFEYFNTIWFCTEHETIFNSDYRREQVQKLEGHNVDIYYEIP